MSITGDMLIDYEYSTPDEFIDFYQEDYSELEEIARREKEVN